MVSFFIESRKQKTAIISLVVVLLLTFSLCLSSCKKTKDNSDSTSGSADITLLIQSDIPQIENEDDPYLSYIFEQYGFNLKIITIDSFATQGDKHLIENKNQVDIVAFSRLADYAYYRDLGLLADIETHLDKLPNFKKSIDLTKSISPDAINSAKQLLSFKGKYHAFSTLPAVPTNSLRIRTDWLKSYGYERDYQPKNTDDLLKIANYYRNTDPDLNGKKDTYAFTSDNASIGNLGDITEMISQMFGRVNNVSDGFFINDKNEVDHGILSGSHKETLDFIKKLVEKDLVEPTWFGKTGSATSIVDGNVGAAWYGNDISKLTEQKTSSEILTLDFWNTVNLPAGNKNGGKLGVEGVFENLFAVTSSAASDNQKLEKILPFLNDLITTYNVDEKGEISFNRSKTYDALVYGVGIEKNHGFISTQNRSSVYINANSDGFYRTKHAHVENYYSWFKSSYDGVFEGEGQVLSDSVIKTMENAEKQLAQPLRIKEGSLLSFDKDVVSSLSEMITRFEYNYVLNLTRKVSKKSPEEEYQEFKENFLNSGGNNLLKEAEKQFKSLGIL